MKKTALKLAVAAAALASAGAMAATNPAAPSAPTSVGDIVVSVTVGSVVLISNLDDVDLGNWTDVSLLAAGGTSANETACVYASNGSYSASLTSLNGVTDYTAAMPASAGQLAAAAVAPGGEAFVAPGDPTLQAADDIGANAPGVPGDGICSTADGDLNCVVDIDGAAAVPAIAPQAAQPMVAEDYAMAGPGGNVPYSVTWNGTASDGSPINGTGSPSQNCNGIDNSTMVISLAGNALGGMTDGYYSDTLTITITAL